MPVVGRYSYRFTFFWHPCHIWSELGILICSPVERERERENKIVRYIFILCNGTYNICTYMQYRYTKHFKWGDLWKWYKQSPISTWTKQVSRSTWCRIFKTDSNIWRFKTSMYELIFFVFVKHMKLKWISWTCDVHRNLWILAKIVCELHCHIILFFFFCHNSLGITYLSSGRLSSDQLIVVFLAKGVAYREVSKYPLLDKLYSVNTQDWRVFWLFNIFIYLLL